MKIGRRSYLYTKKWLNEMKEDSRNLMQEVSAMHWLNREMPDVTVDVIKRRLVQVARKL